MPIWSVACIYNRKEYKMLELCKNDVTFSPQNKFMKPWILCWYDLGSVDSEQKTYSSHGDHVLEVAVQDLCGCSRKNQGFRLPVPCSDILSMWLLSWWFCPNGANSCCTSRCCFCISVRKKRDKEEEKGMCQLNLSIVIRKIMIFLKTPFFTSVDRTGALAISSYMGIGGRGCSNRHTAAQTRVVLARQRGGEIG